MKHNFDEPEIDRRLDEPEQTCVRRLVRDLPEDAVSLQWRGELNERLRVAGGRAKRRALIGWIWKPTAGLALAAAFAFAVVGRFGYHTPAASTPDVERALLNAHLESTASWEVAGDGMSVNEVKEGAARPASEFNPDDAGLGDESATL